MNSYVDLKREFDALTQQRENIQKEKIGLVMPIYELLRNNKESLGELDNILPRNLKLVSSNVLVLRLQVLEAEISELIDIDEELRNNVLNVVLEIKDKVIEKNREQDIIQGKLNKLNSELGQRKNYVLERKNVLDKLASEINEIKNIIDIRTAYLEENDDLEFGIRLAIQSVIRGYNEKIELLVKERTNILQEIGLVEDLEELVSLGIIENLLEKQREEVREKNKEELTDNTIYVEPVNNSVIEENKEIEDLHIYKDNYSVLPEVGLWSKASKDSSMYKIASELAVDEDLIGKWVVESDGMYVDAEKAKEIEPANANLVLPNNALVNDKEGTYMVPNDDFIPDTFNDEGYEIVSSYKSMLLEQKINDKKKLRILLGLTALAASTSILTTGNVLTGALPLGIAAGSLVSGLVNKPEKSILNRSYKLDDEVSEILSDASLLSKDEKVGLMEASNKVSDQARRIRVNRELGRLDYEELSKLDILNDNLDGLLEKTRVLKK